MSNIPEDVLLTGDEINKVNTKREVGHIPDNGYLITADAVCLDIARAQVQKMIEQGWLSPEQVRERGRKLMKSIVKVLDDNVDFTKYVPHAIGYVVDKMADYDPNDEFWQALKEETEKG